MKLSTEILRRMLLEVEDRELVIAFKDTDGVTVGVRKISQASIYSGLDPETRIPIFVLFLRDAEAMEMTIQELHPEVIQ